MKKLFAVILFAILLIACSTAISETEQGMEREITNLCSIEYGNKKIKALTDGKYKKDWTARDSSSTLRIRIPEEEKAGGILVEWFKKLTDFELKEYDKNGSLIHTEKSTDYFKGYITWLPLHEETVCAELKVFRGGTISELKVYSSGTENPDIQKWQNPPEKTDIMLLVAHQDDEVLWFGGLLPYYSTVRDKHVQVIYMTTGGRLRISEALNCLWTVGVKNIPEIIGYKDSYATGKKAEDVWGGKSNIEKSLVHRIRKYKPDVIVTHDLNGEYGHPQHKLLAKYIVNATKSAANAKKHTDLAKQYGTWNVKKVYLHLSDTNPIYMDWETPSDALGGRTPLSLAEEGFLKHVSQLDRFNMDMGKIYDYTKFGLVYSIVGYDILKNDLLENTPAAN
ncbi:MAG: PIG-L family deacetylase [Clostridia bacterium]|nr:PIG-L family deacetylase [Clostridia bacterium]